MKENQVGGRATNRFGPPPPSTHAPTHPGGNSWCLHACENKGTPSEMAALRSMLTTDSYQHMSLPWPID